MILRVEEKSEFAEPLFSNLKKNLSFQNLFSATLKITSKDADLKADWDRADVEFRCDRGHTGHPCGCALASP